MVHIQKLDNRDEWLLERGKRIGGSEAAAIVGMNPWMTNIDLWELKTGRRKGEDISDNPFVKYGTEAEQYLRALFMLDYPGYEMTYTPNNLITNDRFPFAHASVDGMLKDQEGRLGVWECKTTTILTPAQKAKWENRIPDNYFCQVLWYMAVTEADFAILTAQLKWDRERDSVFKVTKQYRIDRDDVLQDIDCLMQAGAEFYDYILRDERPPLILPGI